MVTIPTWLGGVVGTAIPTSRALGGRRRGGRRKYTFLSISGAGCMPQHAQSLSGRGATQVPYMYSILQTLFGGLYLALCRG